jgi:hypothetical protein
MQLLMNEHCPVVRGETLMQVSRGAEPVGAWLARESVVSVDINVE